MLKKNGIIMLMYFKSKIINKNINVIKKFLLDLDNKSLKAALIG